MIIWLPNTFEYAQGEITIGIGGLVWCNVCHHLVQLTANITPNGLLALLQFQSGGKGKAQAAYMFLLSSGRF